MFSVDFPVRLLDVVAAWADHVLIEGNLGAPPLKRGVEEWLDTNLAYGWEYRPHRCIHSGIAATVYFTSEEDLMLVRLKYGL